MLCCGSGGRGGGRGRVGDAGSATLPLIGWWRVTLHANLPGLPAVVTACARPALPRHVHVLGSCPILPSPLLPPSHAGNGCFTVALAPNFRRVVATEMVGASVELARANLRANGVTNVRVARLTAQEFTEAFASVRRFRRLGESGILLEGGWRLPLDLSRSRQAAADCDISDAPAAADGTPADDAPADGAPADGTPAAAPLPSFVFDRLQTLLVDPPRAGLDPASRQLASAFDRVLYISCNPETLAADLASLSVTHDVTRAARPAASVRSLCASVPLYLCASVPVAPSTRHRASESVAALPLPTG